MMVMPGRTVEERGILTQEEADKYPEGCLCCTVCLEEVKVGDEVCMVYDPKMVRRYAEEADGGADDVVECSLEGRLIVFTCHPGCVDREMVER